jgi:hypothetical protein
VGLAVGSAGFAGGHGKDHRYQEYFLANHPKLDRNFLVGVDAMLPVGTQAGAGVELRAHVFEALHVGENCRQDFLQMVAVQCGKYQKRKSYSTDSPETQLNTSSYAHKPDRKQRLWASASAGAKLVRHASVTQARVHHADKVDRLTQQALVQWIQQPAHFTDQIDYMLQQLATDQNCQEHKHELRQTILPVHNLLAQIAQLSPKPQTPAPAPSPVGSVQADPQGDAAPDPKCHLRAYLQDQEKALLRDLSLDAQMQVLGFELRGMKAQIAAGEGVSPTEMALARKRFMVLQMGARYDAAQSQVDTEKSASAFAQFLQRDMPHQYKYLRGVMVETEMQVEGLRAAANQLRSG